jgi:hypothetical protein
MKKQRVSPATNLNPSVFKANTDLPTPEAVNKAVAAVTGKTEIVEKPKSEKVAKVEKAKAAKVAKTEIPKTTLMQVEKVRNVRKRETLKGTILQAVMLEIDLLKSVKRKAFEDEMSLSEVINDALRVYFQ